MVVGCCWDPRVETVEIDDWLRTGPPQEFSATFGELAQFWSLWKCSRADESNESQRMKRTVHEAKQGATCLDPQWW